MKFISFSFVFLSFFINSLSLKDFKSYLVMKNKGLKLVTNKYGPKTTNQIIYNNILSQDKEYLLSVIGPPGTGKTLMACVKAIEKLKENKIEKIIITRPTVAVEDENIGFLPGSLEKKMDPWTRPIYDVFLDYYSKTELNNLICNNQVEISPLGFMRGRTFKNSWIIADEMQNSSPNQMLMLLTRVGINSRIIITGDLQQSDLHGSNGLQDLIAKMESKNVPENFYLVKMNETDIQRSNIVTDVLKLYEKDDKKNKIQFKNVAKKDINDDAALIPVHHISKHF